MNINALSIDIHRPISEVFLYVMSPKNAAKWIAGVQEQEAPRTIKKGTKYRNKDFGGKWTDYIVTELVPDKIFELSSKDGNFHARYAYEEKIPGVTTLTYTEWVDVGGIFITFPPENLERLKIEIEKVNHA